MLRQIVIAVGLNWKIFHNLTYNDYLGASIIKIKIK